MRYISKLSTPHPEIAKRENISQESLVGSLALTTIIAELESSKTEIDPVDAQISAAYDIAAVIRRSLRFTPDHPDKSELSPDSVAVDATTNCHGYTIITSEALDSANIPHYLGFANGHSFILLSQGDKTTESYHLIDTPTRALYANITEAIYEVSSNPDSSTRGKSAWLDTAVVLAKSDFTDKIEAERIRPWLCATQKHNNYLHVNNSINKVQSKNKLILRFYPPKLGRHTIEAYSNLTHAIKRRGVNGDSTLRAYEWLQQLDGTYPDIDKRNKLYGATQLVQQLGKLALVDESLDTIRIVKNSTTNFTYDLAIQTWPINQKRRLAKMVNSRELLTQAFEEYETLYENRLLQGKKTGYLLGLCHKTKQELQKY